MEKLNEGLQSAPWHVCEVFYDIDDIHFFWQSLFTHVVDEHLSLKQRKVRSKDVAFMTKDWTEAIKKKRKYTELFAKNRSVENFELKKKSRNIATPCRRKAIREYWSKISVDLGRNPWKYYNTFKPFLGKEKQTTPTTILISRQK